MMEAGWLPNQYPFLLFKRIVNLMTLAMYYILEHTLPGGHVLDQEM